MAFSEGDISETHSDIDIIRLSIAEVSDTVLVTLSVSTGTAQDFTMGTSHPDKPWENNWEALLFNSPSYFQPQDNVDISLHSVLDQADREISMWELPSIVQWDSKPTKKHTPKMQQQNVCYVTTHYVHPTCRRRHLLQQWHGPHCRVHSMLPLRSLSCKMAVDWWRVGGACWGMWCGWCSRVCCHQWSGRSELPLPQWLTDLKGKGRGSNYVLVVVESMQFCGMYRYVIIIIIITISTYSASRLQALKPVHRHMNPVKIQ